MFRKTTFFAKNLSFIEFKLRLELKLSKNLYICKHDLKYLQI